MIARVDPQAPLAAQLPDPLAVLRERRSRPALTAPGPSRDELHTMLVAAAAAPDHGRLRPWRFVVVDDAARVALGDAFAAAHAERNPDASAAELARSRTRPLRAPVIVVVVGAPRPHPTIGVREQRAAAVCVAYGLLLAAHATGYGAMWRTGWAGAAPKVRAHLGLAEHEEVTAWVYLGTPAGSPPPARREAELPVTWLH